MRSLPTDEMLDVATNLCLSHAVASRLRDKFIPGFILVESNPQNDAT